MSKLPLRPRSATLQTLAFARDPVRTLHTYARRYGDPFTLRLFTSQIVLTGRPEGIQEIFTAPPQSLTSNSVPFLAPLTGARWVLMLYGTPHRRECALLMPPFHGARMQAYGALIQQPMTLCSHALPAGIAVGAAIALTYLNPIIYLPIPIHAVFDPNTSLIAPTRPSNISPLVVGLVAASAPPSWPMR
jgi:cytochrome P450